MVGRIMRVIGLVVLAAALAACAGPKPSYIRASGQIPSPEQVEIDQQACAAQSDNHMCMVARGYFAVPEDQVAARAAELRAISEENMRQQQLAAQAAEKERKAAMARSKKKKRTVNTRR